MHTFGDRLIMHSGEKVRLPPASRSSCRCSAITHSSSRGFHFIRLYWSDKTKRGLEEDVRGIPNIWNSGWWKEMFHSFNTRFFVCSLCGRASLKKSEWNVVAIFALKWSWLITLGNSVFNQRDIDIAEPACNNVCSCSRTFSRYTT